MTSEQMEAKERGERKRSDFSKKEIMEWIGSKFNSDLVLKAKKLTVSQLRKICLANTEKYFNEKSLTYIQYCIFNNDLELNHLEYMLDNPNAIIDEQKTKVGPWHPCKALFIKKNPKNWRDQTTYILFGRTDCIDFDLYAKSEQKIPYRIWLKLYQIKDFEILDYAEGKKSYMDIFNDAKNYDLWLEKGVDYKLKPGTNFNYLPL